MRKNSLLILLMVSMLCITGCKKIPVLPTNDNSQMIVGKSWKMTAYTDNGVDTFTAYYQSCERDNIQVFTADGKYKVDEGAIKCNDDDPQTYEEGNWEIKDNKLMLTEAGLSVQSTILELNENTLKYTATLSIGIGAADENAHTLVLTFTAQ